MSDSDLIGKLWEIGRGMSDRDKRILQAAANRIKKTSISIDAIGLAVELAELGDQQSSLSVEEFDKSVAWLIDKARSIARTPAGP